MADHRLDRLGTKLQKNRAGEPQKQIRTLEARPGR